MALTCPYCGSIYGIKRRTVPSVESEIQTWHGGQKAGLPDVDISWFDCSDCGKSFSADGMTVMEKKKFA
jgi:transposase-like protein